MRGNFGQNCSKIASYMLNDNVVILYHGLDKLGFNNTLLKLGHFKVYILINTHRYPPSPDTCARIKYLFLFFRYLS